MRIRCPENLQFAFTPLPPYIYRTADYKIGGIIKDFLIDALKSWCPDETNITYTEVSSGFAGLEDHIMNDTADVIFPLPSGMKKKFFLGRPYVPLVESPGIAFFSSKDPNAGDAIVKALSNAWPVLVIVIMSAMIAGMAFWFSELLNETRKPTKEPSKDCSFSLDGLFKGFYWAMVSMTTVGYGDFYPKSSVGRLLATIWILTGIVIISLFTASVTTILLAACLENDMTLNGAKISMIEKSTEYNLAVKRNAIPFEKSTVEEIVKSMERTQVDGAVLDSFVAGYYQEKFGSFRLVDIIEHVFAYGAVFTRKGLWVEGNIREYTQNNKDRMFRYISSSVRPLKPNKMGSAAEEKSSSLLDIHNHVMHTTLLVITSFILALVVIGNLWDRCYLRRKKKSTESKGHGTALDTAFSNKTGDLYELQVIHLKNRLVLLNEMNDEITDFRDLIKVKLALFQKKNGIFCDEDDLAISNIELVT